MHRRLWLTICLAAAGCALRSSLPELGDVPAFTLTAQDGTAVSRDSDRKSTRLNSITD